MRIVLGEARGQAGVAACTPFATAEDPRDRRARGQRDLDVQPRAVARVLPAACSSSTSGRCAPNLADMSPDPVAVTPSAWALAHLGTPVLPHLRTGRPGTRGRSPSATARSSATGHPGWSLLAAPFYWLFHSASPWDQYPASDRRGVRHGRQAWRRSPWWSVGLATAADRLATALIAGTATTTWAVVGHRALAARARSVPGRGSNAVALRPDRGRPRRVRLRLRGAGPAAARGHRGAHRLCSRQSPPLRPSRCRRSA